MGPQATKAIVSRGPASFGCGSSATTMAATPTGRQTATTARHRRSLKPAVIRRELTDLGIAGQLGITWHQFDRTEHVRPAHQPRG